MGLLIVILNYRTTDLTVDCLRSLSDKIDEVPRTRAIVVDNGSGDGSAARLANEIAKQGWSGWATLLALPKNIGFAAGNNVALRQFLAEPAADDYVLLLNSDTVVHAGALAHCRRVMDEDAGIGLMTCKLVGVDGRPQQAARRWPTPLRLAMGALGLPWTFPRLFGWANPYDVPESRLLEKHDCGWIAGAFMFIRRSALERVGLMDEAFFFYGEDMEWCSRFRAAGYRVHYDPAVSIVHIGGSSSDAGRLNVHLRDRYDLRARYMVQRRCHGVGAAWLVRTADIIGLSARKMRLLWRGRRGDEEYRRVGAMLRMLLQPLGSEPAGRNAPGGRS